MVAAINTRRIRSFFGLVTLIMGIFAIILSVALGISGLVLYFGQGDLFWLGNPGAGPGVTFMLIIEGFLLELGLAMSTVLFGYSVKGNLHPSLEILRKAKSKLMSGTKSESEEDDLEGTPRKKPKSRPRLDRFRENFEAKAPKCLWISLLLLSGVNLGISLTCAVLAAGDEPLGVGLAMRRYGTDPAARRAVDWVQQAGECCGDQVYTDWLNVQWCTEMPNLVPSEVGPPGYVDVCGPKHRSVKNDVPESCCTPPRSPCIHDPMDLLGLGPLHNDGCSRYIKDQLDPKYISIAKFHLFLCVNKLLLVGLVLLLRPKDEPNFEKATDEEAKGLMDDEDTKNAGASSAALRSKPSSKSWLKAIAKKPSSPKTPDAPTKEEQSEQSGLKSKESKKQWYSAVKFTDPLKSKSKVMGREEGKTHTPGGPATEMVEKKAVGSQAIGSQAGGLGSGPLMANAVPSTPAAGPARPVSEELRKRSLEMRSSRMSRTRSFDSEPVSPRANVRGSQSEWSRPVAGSRPDVFGQAAAQITPSRHEERRLSAVGLVH